MTDALDHGITVTEIPSMEQPIDVNVETSAAFVGRTLRGPLDTPVPVSNYGDYRRRFGGDWVRSGMSSAVRQFFDHGGRELTVVRVANAARGAMLVVPASGSALVLRAVEPGSTEKLRAAIDYDGLDDDERFNLVLQRIDPESGVLQDQELHRDLSFAEGGRRFVADVLSTSLLARVEHPFPTHRPESTGANYVDAVQDGNDGNELSDYDVVGSRRDSTGLFSLNGIDRFDLLYLPAIGRHRQVGPTGLLAAELYCRERGAALVVDPSRDWETVDDAVLGMRKLGFASSNMLGYFPRMLVRGEDAPLDAGGAVAGLLSRLDREHGTWHDVSQVAMQRRLQPSIALSGEDEQALSRAGLNAIVAKKAAQSVIRGDRTMGRGNESHTLYARLSTRRTLLRIVNCIDHATRWAVFEQTDAALVQQVSGQLSAFLSCLADLEAFDDDDFSLDCSVLSPSGDTPGLSIDISFTPRGAGSPVFLTLQQSVGGMRVVDTAFARPSV
ncbi:MAG: hypothetical protein AAGF72_09865 [Pseudomonadota bacterium]